MIAESGRFEKAYETLRNERSRFSSSFVSDTLLHRAHRHADERIRNTRRTTERMT